jgi:hypothetical protein
MKLFPKKIINKVMKQYPMMDVDTADSSSITFKNGKWDLYFAQWVNGRQDLYVEVSLPGRGLEGCEVEIRYSITNDEVSKIWNREEVITDAKTLTIKQTLEVIKMTKFAKELTKEIKNCVHIERS